MVGHPLIRTLALLLATALPAAAAQDKWPALYDVVGVASSDILNIRSAPGADAEIIGALAPDSTGIEVIRSNEAGTWGLVNTGEAAGWASLSYLERQGAQWQNGLPDITECYGTEPFWNLTRRNGLLAFEALDNDRAIRVEEAYMVPALGRSDRYAISGNSIASGITLFVHQAACSDGMSDRAYGLTGSILIEDAFDADFYAGCCSIQPPAE